MPEIKDLLSATAITQREFQKNDATFAFIFGRFVVNYVVSSNTKPVGVCLMNFAERMHCESDKNSRCFFFFLLKISFRGTVNSSGEVMFAIDDVSFSPEKCEKIPFTDKQSRNCFLKSFSLIFLLFSICFNFINPLTPMISLVILLTVCHIVLVILVWRIWYWIN